MGSDLFDVETNVFLSDKQLLPSISSYAVICFKTRKARERRLRAATRALSVHQLALCRVHTATGADVSRRNLSISAIEKRGRRSAREGRRRPRLTRRSNVAGLTSRASAASTRVSASFGASKKIRWSFTPRPYAPRHDQNRERVRTLCADFRAAGPLLLSRIQPHYTA